jgi:capsule biosynthesis phosphatase
MNIIIPIGGVGQRFKEDGYITPKPLINVLGDPMICHLIKGLSVKENDTVVIIYNQDLKSYNFEDLIRFKFPDLNLMFVSLDRVTKGASETILFGIEHLDLRMDENFLILDCDTFYDDDILEKYRECNNKNTIFYFKDNQELPIFSYIKIENENVTDIMEKVKISDNANTGAYGFKHGTTLKRYCERIKNKKAELYVSLLYKEMLNDGIVIGSKSVENFSCVGTPLQLKVYCESNKPKSPKRFCFDLDNTLVTYPKIPGDYSSVEPIKRNIDYLKFLKDQGNHIIIYTARRMKTHKGNVGGILADVGKITLETLERFDIPYDEIFFGKPHADFYIDDLGVNAFHQIDKTIGFIDSRNEPRYFNEISYTASTVTKKTNNPGEIYWYKELSSKIKGMIPKIISNKDQEIEMERIDGINCSYLYVNGDLKLNDIGLIIESIKKIHTSSEIYQEELDIYGNYRKKLEKRYCDNPEIYGPIDSANDIFVTLNDRLSEYENRDLGKIGVIHGDPVFTNIFITETGIKFIDPRGSIGSKLSIFGDIYYDFSKIYQSILGYDFIINDLDLRIEYQNNLRLKFESYFSSEEMSKIRLITASLIFSLLPLHKKIDRKTDRYIKIVKSLLQQKNDMEA